MIRQASDFGSDEFSLPLSIEVLGSTLKTDGAVEAWIAAQKHGYVFDDWRGDHPFSR